MTILKEVFDLVSQKDFSLSQDMENMIRSQLDQIYFGTSKNVVDSMRSLTSLQDEQQKAMLISDLQNAIHKKEQAK